MLSGEVGPFTQQLALRQGEDAGSLSNQHRVVQPTVTWGGRDQVPSLNTNRLELETIRRHSVNVSVGDCAIAHFVKHHQTSCDSVYPINCKPPIG